MLNAKLSGQKKRQLKLKRKQPRKKTPRSYRMYALSLENGKYYVGLTAYKDVTRRFNEHIAGRDKRGAKWTSLHKPIAIIEVRELGVASRKNAEKLETLMTLEYIKKFSIENVRGGELCAVNGYFISSRYAKLQERQKYMQAGPVVVIRKRTSSPDKSPNLNHKQPTKLHRPKRKVSKKEYPERSYQRKLGLKIRALLDD